MSSAIRRFGTKASRTPALLIGAGMLVLIIGAAILAGAGVAWINWLIHLGQQL